MENKSGTVGPRARGPRESQRAGAD